MYITMPFIDGADLSTILKQHGKLPVARALTLSRQIVAGLVAALSATGPATTASADPSAKPPPTGAPVNPSPGTSPSRVSRADNRSRRSSAAFRLKVRTRMRSGGVPARTRAVTASTKVVVLPVPGPARTSSGPCRCSTTARCAASRTGGAACTTGARTSR